MVLLEVRDLVKWFPIREGLWGRVSGHVHAVNGVSFSIEQGEKVGLVGESGCGKSTLGKTIARLLTPTRGHIIFQGTDLAGLTQSQMKPFRKHLQVIFQDPYGSLNPKMTVFQTLAEPWMLHGEERRAGGALRREVEALLETVGLPQDAMDKYPHEFSGGQRQRIGIARAIATEPQLIIADEPVSALDVSVQAQILNLLDDLCERRGVAFLFISHDLKVVNHFCERIIVMYLGVVVESLPAEHLLEEACHPYTRALLDAIPAERRGARMGMPTLLEGDVPSPIVLPSGCAFHARCPYATSLCAREVPPLFARSAGHMVACHRVDEQGVLHPSKKD